MYNEQSQQEEIQPRRLHPASMFFDFISVIKETIFGFGIGLILTLKESVFYFAIFASAFLLLLIIFSVISWLRFTYRVEDNELRIEQGVFIRKKRYISIHRIHKIDMTANVVHRLFKLVNVQVDTASSSGGAEVELSAVNVSDAVALRKALKKNRSSETEHVQAENSYPKKKITWKRLFIAGSTSGSAGIIIVAILTVFTQIEELIPKKMFNMAYEWLIDLGVIFILAIVAFLAFLLWIFGIAGTMINYGKFTIEKRENELFIKRGLLETKELTIPYDRIQAIGVEQSLIRQPFKFVRVFAVVAGGSFDKMEPFPVLFPLMHEREVEGFLREYVPSYTGIHQDLTPVSIRGRKFYLLRASLFFILSFIPTVYFFPSYSWIPLIFVIISLWFGWLQHKDGGFAVDGKKLILRRRRLQKTTIVTYHRRIQVLEKKQHKLQSHQDLASIEVSLIGMGGLGTHYSLKHVEDKDANQIASWYSYRDKEEANR